MSLVVFLVHFCFDFQAPMASGDYSAVLGVTRMTRLNAAQRGSTRLNRAAEPVLPVFAEVARDASDAEIKKAYRKDLETWDLHGFFNGFFNDC